MPELPEGWHLEEARWDTIGYHLGGYRDAEGNMEPAVYVRLEHHDPLAFASVACRTPAGLADFLDALRGITPHLRHGMKIEVNYYSDRAST